MMIFNAAAISPGLAMGKLLLLEGGPAVPEARAVTDTSAEWERAAGAIERAKTELSALYDQALESIGAEAAEIFEIHGMMLDDDDFTDSVREIIETERLNAEYAAYGACERFAGMLEATGSDVMLGRAADMRDLSRRLVGILRGDNSEDALTGAVGPVVVAAEELYPSQTVQMDKSLVLAFVCRRGSKTSHAAILARSLGIPAVSGLGEDFDLLNDGDEVIVDGGDGEVIVWPDAGMLEEYERKRRLIEEESDILEQLRGLPAQTKDGLRVELCANIGHPGEAGAALDHDAEGVGLFRSEFLYLDGDDFPGEDEQFNAYKEALEAFAPRRVVIRTLDFGADKRAPYFSLPEEENPALGYRAIRICLDRPDVFEPQMRALLRASAYGKLAVMFPMITGVGEVRCILEFIGEIKRRLDEEGIPYADDMELGIMIETPAAVAMAPELAELVDFFSVGTNDLTQYTMAADRMNPKVEHLFDPGDPAVLRMIMQAASAAREAGIWIGICGESAADERLLSCYIAMGIDELSMSPHSILRIKRAVRELDAGECRAALGEMLNKGAVRLLKGETK